MLLLMHHGKAVFGMSKSYSNSSSKVIITYYYTPVINEVTANNPK